MYNIYEKWHTLVLPYISIVRVATPHSTREGRGLVTFAADAGCTGIHLLHRALVEED